jgi:hypothetical protein
MPELYQNFLEGVVDNSPLASGGPTLTSTGLTALLTVAAPDVMWITINPSGVGLPPEIVQVTTHTAAAGSATIARAQQGTTAQSWAQGTAWRTGLTKSDTDRFPHRILTATGDTLYASAANTPARLAVGATGQVLTVTAGVPAWAGGAVKLGEATPTSGQTVTFSSLPAVAHMRIMARVVHDDTSAGNAHRVIALRFNGDSGANYNYMLQGKDGAGTETTTQVDAATILGFGWLGDIGGSFTVDIVDTGAATSKSVHAFGISRISSASTGTNWRSFQGSGLWTTAAVVTSVAVTVITDNYAGAGNRISLYGVG